MGALHPIAAFASKYSPANAKNIVFDFYGDEKALEAARRIVSTLDSNLLVLKSETQRSLLHAACTFISNATVVSVRAGERLISNFIDRDDVNLLTRKLLSSSVENLSNNNGVDSLTGPLIRGDAKVIAKHLKILENEGSLLQFYKSWSLLGIDLIMNNKPSKAQVMQLKEIKKMLEEK